MKVKTPLPLILLTLLLTQIGYTQTPPELLTEQSNGYGIESETLYLGSMILEILAAAEAEIEQAVDEAYAEGYKAASLRYAPDLAAQEELLKAASLSLTAEQKKSRYFWPSLFITGGLSLIGGFFIHAAIVQ